MTVTPGRTLFDSSLTVPSIVPDDTLCANAWLTPASDIDTTTPNVNHRASTPLSDLGIIIARSPVHQDDRRSDRDSDPGAGSSNV
ncbi:MAG: hypothetical protein DMG01_05285 [Acidobacteria bacterium]|nr:MAG: hypothetical protein DMG01_05285 [Acidobacteriota bacterium]